LPPPAGTAWLVVSSAKLHEAAACEIDKVWPATWIELVRAAVVGFGPTL
jgi:hypothetical protein